MGSGVEGVEPSSFESTKNWEGQTEIPRLLRVHITQHTHTRARNTHGAARRAAASRSVAIMRASCRRALAAAVMLILALQAYILTAELLGTHFDASLRAIDVPAGGESAINTNGSDNGGHGGLGALTMPSLEASPPSSTVSPDDNATEVRRRRAARRRALVLPTNGSTPFFASDQLITREALPNIVMMVADDLQPHDLYKGSTANIDGIGATGLKFGNAHTPAPLGTPSRYSILTGRHATCQQQRPQPRQGEGPTLVRQVGVDGISSLSAELASVGNATSSVDLLIDDALETDAGDGGGGGGGGIGGTDEQPTWAAPTIASLLRERGYATGFVGKWLLGVPEPMITPDERARVVATDVASSQKAWRGVQPTVLKAYRSAQRHVRRCGFDYAERLYVDDLRPDLHVLPASMLFHNTEWVADGANRFVAMHRRRGPFFLHVGWTLPRAPDVLLSLAADPRYTPGGLWAANRSHVLARREAVCRAAKVSTEALLGLTDERASRRQPAPMEAGAEASPRFGHRHYPLALAWLDSGVGELMDFLRANRLDRNTLTVFTSDHAAFDEGHCYQGGSRVPLLMRWPAAVLPRGAPLPHPVSHLDLLPTLLHATNARLPGEPAASGGGGGGGALSASQQSTPIATALIPSLSLNRTTPLPSLPVGAATDFPPPSLPSPLPATPPAAVDVGADGAANSSSTAESPLTSASTPPPPPPGMAGRSLAALMVGAAKGVADPGWQEGWAHGSVHQRTLFCEAAQTRAAFTSKYRLLYAPHAAPAAKMVSSSSGGGGGAAEASGIGLPMLARHHPSYWRPLQLYDTSVDMAEQRNLVVPAERAALNLSHAEEKALHDALNGLRRQLVYQLSDGRLDAECTAQATMSMADPVATQIRIESTV